LVNPVLPLHIAAISLVFKDPGDGHLCVSAIADGRAVLKEATRIRRWSVSSSFWSVGRRQERVPEIRYRGPSVDDNRLWLIDAI
jgi:hypothetical protein